MGINDIFDIPYIRLRFQTEILSDAHMPETKTAALRGGMGEMLFRQNCVADRNCEKCRFNKVCVVWHTFYTPMEKKPVYVTGDESVGYLLECMDTRTEFAQGSSFEFALILFGDSIAYFNIYLQALYQLGMVGLGKEKAKFRINVVYNTQGRQIIRGNEVNMNHYRIQMVSDYIRRRKEELQSVSGDWTLIFRMPLSMKYQKEYMDQFYAEALVKGAARRVQMLDHYIGTGSGLPEFFVYPEIRKQTVRETKVKRYSRTQDSHMTLRGITGKIVFDSMPDECMDYLIAGELTHIGRNTSFGFGKYILRREV